MSIAAALLLIGACGSASRTMTVDASIEQIVLQVVVGGVKDVIARSSGQFDSVLSAGERIDLPSLRIDGQPRTGVLAWLAAAGRVAGYAISRRHNRAVVGGIREPAESVEYSYRLRVRGLDIRRSTRIEDGRVSLVTDVYGSIADGRLNHVRLVLVAVERGSVTRLHGEATGWSPIGERCAIVNRVASRVIADALDRELLARIQRGGIDLYRAGAIVEAMR